MNRLWRHSAPPRPYRADGSAHYSLLALEGDGMDALRQMFPDGEANDLNLALFSTSGVHGTYCTIEDVEEDMQRPEREGPRDVTFLVLQPRIVCLRYGNCKPQNAEDIAFLKKLRASSLRAVAGIGIAYSEPSADAASQAREQDQQSAQAAGGEHV